MIRPALFMALLMIAGCGGPKSKGEDCIYSNSPTKCSQMCRNTYKSDQKKVLACQQGVREESARKSKVDQAFGRSD